MGVVVIPPTADHPVETNQLVNANVSRLSNPLRGPFVMLSKISKG